MRLLLTLWANLGDHRPTGAHLPSSSPCHLRGEAVAPSSLCHLSPTYYPLRKVALKKYAVAKYSRTIFLEFSQFGSLVMRRGRFGKNSVKRMDLRTSRKAAFTVTCLGGCSRNAQETPNILAWTRIRNKSSLIICE